MNSALLNNAGTYTAALKETEVVSVLTLTITMDNGNDDNTSPSQ